MAPAFAQLWSLIQSVQSWLKTTNFMGSPDMDIGARHLLTRDTNDYFMDREWFDLITHRLRNRTAIEQFRWCNNLFQNATFKTTVPVFEASSSHFWWHLHLYTLVEILQLQKLIHQTLVVCVMLKGSVTESVQVIYQTFTSLRLWYQSTEDFTRATIAARGLRSWPRRQSLYRSVAWGVILSTKR